MTQDVQVRVVPIGTVRFQFVSEVMDALNARLINRQEARLILGLDNPNEALNFDEPDPGKIETGPTEVSA